MNTRQGIEMDIMRRVAYTRRSLGQEKSSAERFCRQTQLEKIIDHTYRTYRTGAGELRVVSFARVRANARAIELIYCQTKWLHRMPEDGKHSTAGLLLLVRTSRADRLFPLDDLEIAWGS